MVIASVDNFINIKGIFYCKPYSYMSLSQYWDLDANVKLLGIEVFNVEIPLGWIAIPENIIFYPINGIDQINFVRRKEIKKDIWEFIKNEKLVYLRMPDYRILEIYKLIKGKINFFCEYHGDWGESLLTQKLNRKGLKNKFKCYLANYRAKVADRYIEEIGANSRANISIGPALINKYKLDRKPFLVTTNHIVKKSMIEERNRFDLNSGIINILFVGELQHRKGLHYLLSALKCSKENLKMKFTLKIVGAGYLEKELRDIVKEYHLQEEVDFKGAIYDRNELNKEYRNADLFILPSIAGEGVPRVLQEAQSFGCPIIATNIGSTYWQLKNESGILIEPRNSKAIVNSIKMVYEKGKRKSLSLNATRNAYEFTYENQREGIKYFLHKNL